VCQAVDGADIRRVTSRAAPASLALLLHTQKRILPKHPKPAVRVGDASRQIIFQQVRREAQLPL